MAASLPKIAVLPRPVALFGGALAVAGALVPADTLILFLTGRGPDTSGSLLTGALAFKVSLVVLGIALAVLSLVAIWDAPQVDKPRRSWSKKAWLLLAALLVAATAVRLYRLDAGLWLDEVLTNVLFARLPFGDILTTYQSENQHFLYSLMAHASFLLFGDNAWALRLPAVLFGVGSLWATYLLGAEVAGEREGLLATALLAFSYQHVWFSQNARGYTGLLFWTALSSWLLLRAMQEDDLRLWLGFALTAALGVFTHITMIFVIAGQFLVYAGNLYSDRKAPRPNRWAGLFVGFGMAGLLTFQFHALALPSILGGVGQEAGNIATYRDPLWTLLQFAQGLELGFGTLVAGAAVAVFAVGVVSYWRTRKEIVLLLTIPSLLGAATVMAVGHYLWPRFFFFALSFAALVAIRGTLSLAQWGGRLVTLSPAMANRLATVGCLALVLVSARSVPFAYGPKQDYQGALDFVQANRQAGDAVVVVGLAVLPYKDYLKTDWIAVDTTQDLDAVESRADRTWLLYTMEAVVGDFQPDILDRIHRQFKPVREFGGTLAGGEIVVCLAETNVGARKSK